MVTNKVMMAGQRQYFDSNPCIMILPILTITHAKNWTGGAYDAIMLIDEFIDDNSISCQVQEVAQTTHFNMASPSQEIENIAVATREDKAKAINLCREYTLGIFMPKLN